MTPVTLVEFAGPVACRRDPGPLGLTLIGDGPLGTVYLAFVGRVPPDLPATLDAPVAVEVTPGGYRIAAGARAWQFGAGGHFLHRDITRAFEAAVPPRRVPWYKRLFWLIILGLAGTRAGTRLFARRAR